MRYRFLTFCTGLTVALSPACIMAAEPQDGSTVKAAADERDDQTSNPNDLIIVYGRSIRQIGVAISGSQGTVGYADIENLPISRTGELVENVPGVIATQHSGTGKANQYFLRGFNLDHGTDFAGFVDGVPINMPTHGHGQGYLDFNFIIPETVEKIDFRKGPYFADVGNFSAAGTIAFATYDTIEPFAQATVGMFGFYRATAAGSAPLGSGNVLLAIDGTFSNGPWVLDENLEKYNGLIKFSSGSRDDGFSVQLNGYHARWDSTDQIPERAVQSGLVDRFGFIDDDVGGNTTRVGLVANGAFDSLKINAFATYYDLTLTSNFTYFLENPVVGDQFQQVDRRAIFGGTAQRSWDMGSTSVPISISAGGNVRYDRIDRVGLFRSAQARPIATVRSDQVDKVSAGVFVETEVKPTDRLRVYLALRGDYLAYDVDSDLKVNSGSGSDTIFGPKFGAAWRMSNSVELYANYGESFHTNDVRGASISVDPVSGLAADRVPVFARARGAEIGGRIERDTFNLALVGFYLGLESELVFVGDAGATEPNDASQRFGVEANAFWRPMPWLTLDAAYAYTHARFRGVSPDARRIPGAVAEVLAGGMTANPLAGLDLTLRLRHFGKAPLIEDGSTASDPTTLVNFGAYFTAGSIRIGAELLNIFDAQDSDITYFYASQLASETAPVEDRHFHPVEPRQVRVSARFAF
ncbi:TonB-dependent receptor [Blastomonas sp.]|uniref:TonB-dependent receptor n=1 Tax=Blastomonas sp. TaxID=1909299 RepID=UPI003593F6CB